MQNTMVRLKAHGKSKSSSSNMFFASFSNIYLNSTCIQLAKERGKRPPGADMSLGMEGLKASSLDLIIKER